MDPFRNPFAPGAGNPPPELAGRQDVVDQAQLAIKRTVAGRHSPSQILVGLRGVGKTVLLNKLDDIAQAAGAITIFVEVHEGKSLPALLAPAIRQAFYKLSTLEAARDKARQGLRVLKSFMGAVRISVGEVDVGLSMDSEPGVADSGDIEADLPELVAAVGEAARSASKAVCLILDELQYLREEEFSALIMAVHRTSQKSLPVLLVGAGLPQILGLAGNSKSYSERLFRYPEIGALAEVDAISALRKPVEGEGAEITDQALARTLEITQRYPYFLQQWGHELWNVAADRRIVAGDVDTATDRAIAELDQSFFKVRLDRCTNSERKYMRGLAELGAGTHRSGDVADVLGVKVSSVAPARNNLIRKGMIYSPAHGDTAFTVPLFDAYMKRAMPQILR